MRYFGKCIIALVLLQGTVFGQESVQITPLEYEIQKPGEFANALSGIFQQDKIKHFSTSLMLVTTSGYYLRYTNVSGDRQTRYSVGFSFSLGISKEIFDRYSHKGHASWGDILADLSGSVCGGILLHNFLL